MGTLTLLLDPGRGRHAHVRRAVGGGRRRRQSGGRPMTDHFSEIFLTKKLGKIISIQGPML
jgi:hypothetical protein